MACGRPGCGFQLRLFTAPVSTIQARGPHMCPSPPPHPRLTPASGCGLIPGIALMVEMSELSKPEEELRTQAQGPVEAQLLGPEAGETASAPPPVSALAPGSSE